MTILVVDDNEPNIYQLQVLLGGNGYQVVTAANGAEALAKARQKPPDLIVSDILMPVMDGFALCREWKKDERLRQIPFVFYTATYTDERDREFALSLGAEQFLVKPEEPEVFIQTIREVIQQVQRSPAPPARVPIEAPPQAEVGYLKQYSEVLIRKLEAKMEQLEQTNRELERDITERKRAEGALQASETRYRRLFEAAKDGILILDADTGEIRDVNPFLADLLKYSREEMLSKKLWDIGPLKDALLSKADFEELLGEGHIRYEDLPLETRDGRHIEVEFVSNVYLVDHQKVIQCNIRDITEHKRAEAAWRESEERFRSLVENATVGIYRTTPDGRVLMANPALVKMLGYENFEALASRNLEQESSEHGYTRADFREQIERDGGVVGLERAWTRQDGSTVFVRESARGIRGENGKILYYDGIVEDVTEWHKLQEQLRQAAKMETVGRFAGGVAHDFNNLLTIISGFSQLLLERLEAGDPRRAYVNEIQGAEERAAVLTRQLLAFGRRQVLLPQVLDLNEIVVKMDKMLRPLLGEDVELVTVLPPDLGRVKADPGQIEQVMLNLAVNARDAMPGGGKLRLETANVDLDEAYALSHAVVRTGPYVVLSVSDTGCGMDAEIQSHLFEPFFTTKEKGKGTGLGLATSYGIIKQSGGYIWVYSEPGQGATFKIYLPRVQELPEPVAVDQVQAGPALGSETVLLVEDEASVRLLVRGVLEARGYTVLEAGRANEALQICQQHPGPIHLLLTDVVMPQASGPALAKSLQVLLPEMKVLYMSGYTDHAVFGDGTLQVGIAFLQKPFTPQTLARKVRWVLDQVQSETG